jgi:hypothetical protein
LDADASDDWKDELDDLTHGASCEIKSWPALWTQIEKVLKTQHKSLALLAVNQLIILRNFATLFMKGFGWIQASEHIATQWRAGSRQHFARRIRSLACHYQVFKKLPRETRGGRWKAA